MLTTIQINSGVKDILARMKEKDSESYEEVILKMINKVEEQKRKQRGLMIEGFKAMAEDSVKVNKEWSKIDEDWE
jgi:hypothetical protein